MALVLSDTAGGQMARRLLWLMPLMWVLLDWLLLQGEVVDIYDSGFGLAVSSAGGMVISCVVILFTAHRLRVVDEKRVQALAQLELSNRELEQKVAERTRALTTTNERLADEIAERKLAQEQVHQLSITDELTGLLNRRGFLLLAEQALKTARRVDTPLTLIYVDLDGLKQVNDALGHQAGDEMIQDTARILKAGLRTADLIARMGGDEFAVLAVSGDSPAPILARMAQSLAQFNQGADAARRLSFSVGSVQCLPTDDRPLLEQLAQADANMYAQKRQYHEAAWAASRAPQGTDLK
jgi:diguanylate cyclase (GGDEF)-like protein